MIYMDTEEETAGSMFLKSWGMVLTGGKPHSLEKIRFYEFGGKLCMATAMKKTVLIHLFIIIIIFIIVG